MLGDTSSKQVFHVLIRDNCHATSHRRLQMKVFSSHRMNALWLQLTIAFVCKQVPGKYFSLEFSEEVIRSQIRAFLPGATAHWCEMMILSCKSSFSDYTHKVTKSSTG